MSEIAGKFLSVGYRNDGHNVNVGGAVPERCEDLGLDHSLYVIKHDGTYLRQPDGTTKLYSDLSNFWTDPEIMSDVRLAFIAIPSGEDARELQIIEALQERGIHVVTAAKGAVANHFKQLQPHMKDLGISATVGGGARMLPWLADRMNPRVRQVHGVINGTMNFVLAGIDEGDTAGTVIDQAVTLGYAEPGAVSHLDVLKGEAEGDIPKKTAILWNVAIRPFVEPDHIIAPQDIKQPPLTQDNLNQLIAEATDRRYIVSIMRSEDQRPEKDIIAGFATEINADWVIIGGFRKIGANPLFKRHLKLPGAWNGLVLTAGPNESDGIAHIAAPGAGPAPTAASMVQDARHLLRR